jgi:hypothetical protein
MKRLFKFTLLLLLLSLCACKDRSYPRLLVAADSLTYCKPDSAISLLKRLGAQMNTESKTTQMYYKLLMIRAEDNAYMPYTSDSLIRPILNYYQDKKDSTLLPEVYYYAGRIYLDLGDTPQALKYLQKAIETLKVNSNYRLTSKAFQQIGTLYLYQRIPHKALTAFKEALHYAELSGDSTLILYNMRSIGRSFIVQANMDSAFCYYKEAQLLAQKTNNRSLVSSIGSEVARIYEHSGEYEKALAAIRNSYISPNDPAQYAILAHLYYKADRPDSAHYYYARLLSTGNRYDNPDGYYQEKRNCYKGLSDIARQQGKSAEALVYMDKYLIYTDSVQRALDTESVRKTNALYNYQLREKENTHLKAENGRQRLWILYSGIALLFLFTAFILYRERSKRKSLQFKIQLGKVENLKNELHQQSHQAIEENKEQIHKLTEQIRTLQEKNGLQTKLLQAQKEQIEKSNILIKAKQEKLETDETAFYESEIYSYFRDALHEAHPKITHEQWTSLQTGIDNVYHDFTKRLLSLYSFNEFEQHVCLLLKLCFSTTSIASYTAHSKSAVVSARKRMYEKVFLRAGTPEEWDAFIRSL